ncbi:MAG: hypothetical protein JWR26_536 [Pedosphaera sp.]|nr:hypothetical protein [Pedosphaera sp.]
MVLVFGSQSLNAEAQSCSLVCKWLFHKSYSLVLALGCMRLSTHETCCLWLRGLESGCLGKSVKSE